MLSYDALTNLPLDVSGFLKASSGFEQALPDEEFALICIGPRNQRLRRFPCHNADATKTSAAFLREFGDLLPEEVAQGAAAIIEAKAQRQGVELPEGFSKLSNGAEPQRQWMWQEAWDEKAEEIRQNILKASAPHPAPAPVFHRIHVPGNPLTQQCDEVMEFRTRDELEKVSEWLQRNRKKVSSYQEKVIARGLLDGYEKAGVMLDSQWAQDHLGDLVKLSCGPRRDTVLRTYFEDRHVLVEGVKISSPSGGRKMAMDAYEACLREIHEIDDAQAWTDLSATSYAWKLSQLEQALGIEDDIRAFDVFFRQGQLKSSAPAASPVVWSKDLMILREEDLRAAQMRNLADLAWILGKEQAEALRLDPVKAFKDLEPATQNYVGSFLYDAGHGPRYRGH